MDNTIWLVIYLLQASIPGRLDDLKSAIQSALLDPKGRPVILIVDDLDAVKLL